LVGANLHANRHLEGSRHDVRVYNCTSWPTSGTLGERVDLGSTMRGACVSAWRLRLLGPGGRVSSVCLREIEADLSGQTVAAVSEGAKRWCHAEPRAARGDVDAVPWRARTRCQGL